MTGRQIGAVAGILLGGVACMKTNRVVAVQMAMEIDGGGDIAGGGFATTDVAGADAALGWAPFAPPVLVTGLVSDNTTDIHGPSLTGDELEIYVACQRKGESNFHIWSSRRTARDAMWNPAAMVNELVGSVDEIDPDVSSDGLTLYFASNRPPAGPGFRLYVARRTASDPQWRQITPMQGLGSSTWDRAPSVAPNGLFMVFTSQRNGSSIHLYSATRSDPLGAWETVEELTSIDANMDEEAAARFNGALSLVWSSRGPSGGKTSDLLEVSRLDPSAPFTAPPTALDPLNSTVWEGDPWVSEDGTHILFRKEPVGSPGTIYEAWRQLGPPGVTGDR